MNLLEKYISTIKLHLHVTQMQLLIWFDKDTSLKNYRPLDGGWTVLEILEHISLTSHFLLILIEKAYHKSIKNVQDRDLNLSIREFDYDLSKLDNIGQHKSFPWNRPEHHQPSGTKSEKEIKDLLIEQFNCCLNYLDRLKDGQGLLYLTTMTVDNLGKLNVYEYIYFLSKHAERHLRQIEENEKEYINI